MTGASGLPAGCIDDVVYLCILRADAGKAAATPLAYSNDVEGEWPFLPLQWRGDERLGKQPSARRSSGCVCLRRLERRRRRKQFDSHLNVFRQ